MEPINCAIIGPGYIGKEHARVCAEHPLTELTTVIDIDESRAEEIAGRFGVNNVATDVTEGLSSNPVDFVTVATPKEHHFEPTRQALANDCHVLLEKPIAASEVDAKEIGSLVKEANTDLAIGYLLRFDPSYARLKGELSEFGDILGMRASRITKTSVYRRASSVTNPVYYLAVHDIDMLRWYAGSEVTDVYASGSAGLNGGEGPAMIYSNLTFADGTVASIETNWARPDSHPSHRTEILHVTGTDGSGEIDMDPAGNLPIATDSGFEYGSTSELHASTYGPLRNQLDHMVECIRTDTRPLVTWKDGLHSLRVANAMKESMETEQRVTIDEHSGGND